MYHLSEACWMQPPIYTTLRIIDLLLNLAHVEKRLALEDIGAGDDVVGDGRPPDAELDAGVGALSWFVSITFLISSYLGTKLGHTL
jgi:hypothetical protein